jgi:hypothetical protein
MFWTKNRPFGGHRRREENYIKTGIEEIGCEGVDWAHLTQDKDQWRTLVNMAIHKKTGNFLTN